MKTRISLLVCALAANTSLAACHISTTGLNFGSYDVFDAFARQSMSRLTLWCDPGIPADVAIKIGPSSNSGSIFPRQMGTPAGDDRLEYNLFTDAALTSVWGDEAVGNIVLLSNVTPVKSHFVTLYGAIPAGQNVSAGVYSDAVSVSILP